MSNNYNKIFLDFEPKDEMTLTFYYGWLAPNDKTKRTMKKLILNFKIEQWDKTKINLEAFGSSIVAKFLKFGFLKLLPYDVMVYKIQVCRPNKNSDILYEYILGADNRGSLTYHLQLLLHIYLKFSLYTCLGALGLNYVEYRWS